MSPEQLYQHLKDLAEKLGIAVQEQSFKQVTLPVKSGHCRVRGKDLFIMDRNLSLTKKNATLSGFLKTQSHEKIFIPPAVRELLSRK